MSRHLFIIISFAFFCTVNNCYAQDPIKGIFGDKKTNPKAGTSPKPTSKPSAKKAKKILTLTTNEDCTIQIKDINGSLRLKDINGSLRRGQKRPIPLASGMYTLTATSTPASYQFKTEVNIKDSNVSVFIDLTKVINDVVKRRDSIDSVEARVARDSALAKLQGNPVETDENNKLRARIKATADTMMSNMVTIAAGSFTMGNNQGENDELPEHTVAIRAFKFSKYEVTQQQWETVMGTNPSANQGCANCPVEKINIADIDSFISRINRISSGIFRLPSEAEWEYVAKKGGDTKNAADRAWFRGNSNNTTQPVGTLSPNELGIFDMYGNVAEWCRDWYSGNYSEQKIADNPTVPESGKKKVVRGGAYDDSKKKFRPTYRDEQNANTRKKTTGLRLVMDTQ